MDKTTYVKDLLEGDRVDDLFLVQETKINRTKAGKPYMVLTVMDKSGEISGPVWDGVDQVYKICGVGSFIRLVGSIQAYRDKLQLKIDQVIPVADETIDRAAFVIACEGDRDEMARQMHSLISSIENPYLKTLLTNVFGKKEIGSLFKDAPAAKTMHHGYLGGLIEHCLSMAKLADLISSHYSGVDRSLLVAGALLHDIGKLKELAMDVGVIAYTDEGRLKGHLVMGSEMVARAAAKIDNFPSELLQHLQHMILSHHGQLQFGSPTVPMTVEAFLLSQIDDMDAKMNMMEQLRRKMKEPGYHWSDYQRSLERYLYLQPLEDDKEKRDAEKGSDLSRQQSLF